MARSKPKPPADPLADMPGDKQEQPSSPNKATDSPTISKREKSTMTDTQAESIQLVTRQQLLDRSFKGMADPNKELTRTLEAMGLKATGKSFKPETAHCIITCWGWIDSQEVTKFDDLAKLWNERKDQVIADYKANGSALAISEGGAMEQASDFVNPGQSLASAIQEPAQNSYEAGLALTRIAADRIQHNTQLTAQVLDAAFFEGVQDGAVEVKKPTLPPLMTTDQAKSVLTKIKRLTDQLTD